MLEVFHKKDDKTFQNLFTFMDSRKVDEIYCSIDEVNDDEVNQLIKQFSQMGKMMKMMQGGGGRKMMQMMKGMQ